MTSMKNSDDLKKELLSDVDLLYPGAERKSKDRLRYILTFRKYANRCPDWQDAEGISQTLKQRIKHTIYNNKETKRCTLLSLFAGLVIGTGIGNMLGYCEYKNKDKTIQQQNVKDFIYEEFLLIILCALLGMSFSIMHRNSVRDGEAEAAYNDFFRRLVTRYFKTLKPTEEAKMLFKRMNPEMADNIAKILITNLPADDVVKLQKLAVELYINHSNNEEEYAKTIQNSMERGLFIIRKTLRQQPELVDLIREAFNGKLVTTFVLCDQKQNSR